MLTINCYNSNAIKHDSLFRNFNIGGGLEVHRALEMSSHIVISKSPQLVKRRLTPELEAELLDPQASKLIH